MFSAEADFLWNSITILSFFFTAGWYAVTKGNSLSAVFCFCADCLKSKMTSDRDLSIYFFGYPRASRRRLKFARHSSNVVFEEFVLSSRIASPKKMIRRTALHHHNQDQPTALTRFHKRKLDGQRKNTKGIFTT